MKRTLRTIGYWCIALGIYLMSAQSMWQYNHKAFSKGGRWELSHPGVLIIIATYCPILNTACAVIWPLKDLDYSFSNHFKVKP